ncbi:Transcription initiation factor TFIID subunit 11 [Amphibalanus amphitrite]|uniref:Transcription initiation factor TFIID subunit 11 n=1 Tax=Amphibalanus amphitrite TaxID=1232801 RepID=A0A6A4X082_AMPAM|nr:Transcription initiation factor TFIID subunit 11 [Amphibalanus amphitrite]KAF0312708.1 Transcription initiation factor TFIID subunit 11 [Amphibalanus amphitrite]
MSVSSESGSELVTTPSTPGPTTDPLSQLLSSPPTKRVRLDSEADESSDPITPTADSEIQLPRPSESSSQEESAEQGRSRQELEEEEREKMQVLVSYFTEEQLDRYEMYRRAAFPKAAIKRLMQTLTTCSVSQNAVIAMSGIAKVFVGEVMEEALDVKDETDDAGPVQPRHLREAVRRLRRKPGTFIPSMKQRRPVFRFDDSPPPPSAVEKVLGIIYRNRGQGRRWE